MKTRTTKDSFIETGKQLGSGIVGMIAGSAVGRHSLLVGALTIFGGAYYKKDWVTAAGVGMVASNGFVQKRPTTNGIDGITDEMEEAKDRAMHSIKALGKKLYLDKFSTELAQKIGLGNIEDRPLVFMGSEVADQGDFDTSEVDEIIQKIENGEPLPTIDITPEDFEEPETADTIGLVDSDDILLDGIEDSIELNALA